MSNRKYYKARQTQRGFRTIPRAPLAIYKEICRQTKEGQLSTVEALADLFFLTEEQIRKHLRLLCSYSVVEEVEVDEKVLKAGGRI